MKKNLLVLLIVATLALSACGSSENVELVKSYEMIKVHENISDEVLSDANDVIEKIENFLADGNNLTEDYFSSFLDKYETKLDYVNSEEFEFIMALSLLMMNIEGYISGEYNLFNDIDRFYETAKTGEYQTLIDSNEYYEEFYNEIATTFYDNQEDEETESEPVVEGEETVTTDIEDVDEEDNYSQYNRSEIEYDIKGIVDTDLDNTRVTELRVNEDVSVDDERYIVLVNLEWDVKNKPKTTKKMLDMYSDHIAAKIADNQLVYELVLFWEAPYHKENDTILKRTYQNGDSGMYLKDEMKDISIFE